MAARRRRQGSPRVVASNRRNLFVDVMRRPLGAGAAVYLAVVVLASALAPVLAPHDPLKQSLTAVRQGPSAEYPLGTDALGRDLLSRLLYGGQESLIGVAQALIVALVIAVPLGIASGYFGGWFDRVVMRCIDINMAIPNLIVTLAVLAIFRNSMAAAMVVYGVLVSASAARVIRSAALGVREELYIDAARTTGLGGLQILVRHIFPRTLGVIIVQAAMLSAIALGVQTGLAFLGFGPPPPEPTWGGMVGEASSMLQFHTWMIVPTAGVITLTTLAFGLLGDAVRDANAEGIQRPMRPSTSRSRAARGQAQAARVAAAAAVDPVAPAPADALLSVRGLTVAFGSGDDETIVVDGADFDIRRGETVGLVGESGSGKTVTAMAVLGLLAEGGRVVSGRIWFEGADISGYTQAQYRALRGTKMAMISQEPMVALDPAFRIGFQLAEVIRSHNKISWRAARKRAVDLLAAVRLPDPQHVASLYPHQVSGGMAQRVAIAIALAGRPQLLIADEPTTALDVTVQAEILDLLRALQRRMGMAILFVTHDWGVVADICDRAVVLYAGQVVEHATVSEMFRDPLHPYTQALQASDPHNAVKGEPLPTIGGVVPPPGQWPEGCHFAARCRFVTDACRVGRIPQVDRGEGRDARCIRIDVARAARIEESVR
ncbi:dipeptide/oligopeptide/nickel ABC transporter permease/ATP-binding protein [Microbacterium sp. dk485]|uniref:dipeptide/oligopeptide/nickel ABC transporter permease/ATP-binding protein n=1 Tax=Microbacterium sp. dk485 TaxID=2560021 RepID=UPI0010742D70|nr:dipeptide/oligopeptide/nickel ABC transporter permease/ATP-binding protein [Microbacterium sp. dk485]TFV85394.1 dipeptide/oligopeptide/nickel ABC transporter permease/ATP-binding protein [Microbacterium sp. dk485]